MRAAQHNQQQNAVFEQAWKESNSARWANSFAQREAPQSWANSFAAEQRMPSRWIDNFVEEEKSFDTIYNRSVLAVVCADLPSIEQKNEAQQWADDFEKQSKERDRDTGVVKELVNKVSLQFRLER